MGNPTSHDSGINALKFICNVGINCIRLVSKNVQFKIHNYLYDLQSQ